MREYIQKRYIHIADIMPIQDDIRIAYIHRSYLQLLLTLELEGGRCNAPSHLL